MDDEASKNEKDDCFEADSVVIIIHGLSPSFIFEENHNMDNRFVEIFKVNYVRLPV